MSIENYKNDNLKKIINVYQTNYVNCCAQGLGDYLNGCFCLLQLCTKFNINFDIDISNHPISKYFIINKNGDLDNIDYNGIMFYKLPDNIRSNKYNCYNTFINYLNSLNTETHYLFCNFDPFYPVQEFGRNFIQERFRPNMEITNNINIILQKFNLKPKEFEIIHIRTGDKYLLNQTRQMTNYEVKEYKNFLLKNTVTTTNYIIISDNVYLKNQLKSFKNFFINDCDICHTGENGDKNDESLKNTVIDFFLMSHSKNIISISLKSRGGTGFSRLCGVMFNISYKSLLIELGQHFQ